MNSSKKTRVSKKMTAYCHKFTSKKSLGSSCHTTPSGNYRHRVNTLLQNNRTLALALQEKCSELSVKQKLLDEFLEYLNKMKYARFRMLQISSTLKSLAKDCDETLLLLTVDDTKWLDLEVPAQFCRKWETKLDKLEESYQEVTEVDSMSVHEDVVESARNTVENSSNQIIPEPNSTKNLDCRTEELFRQDEAVTKSNYSTDESDSTTAVVPTTLHGGMLVKDKENNIPILLKSAANTEMLPEIKFDSDKNSLPPAENVSKPLKNPSSLQKHLKSKIPLFSAKTKIEANSSEFTSKKRTTEKRKNVKISEERDSDTCRRKTFVIKDAKYVCSPNLNINMKKSKLDPENLLNETMKDISTEIGSTIKNRKTFIVKPSGISEDIDNLPCCSRKTFIKKSSYTRKKSYVKGESDIITSPKCKSTFKLSGESLNIVSDQINNVLNNMNFCSDEKEISNTAVDRNEVSESISEKKAEEFQSNDKFLIDLNVPKKYHLEEISQDSEHFLLNAKLNKSQNCTTYKEHTDLRNVHTKEKDTRVLDNSNCHDLLNDCQTIVENKIEVIDSAVSGSLQKGSIFDLEDKKELNTSFDISNRNPHQHKLNNLSLESLESGMESLNDPNLSLMKEISPLKTSPIKRRVIKPKPKKVFVFDVKNEKSTSIEKSTHCNKKPVIFSVCNQTLAASETRNDCCDSSDVKKELKTTKRKSKAKVRKKCNADVGVIDAIATNCLGNKNMADKSCTIEVNHTNASFSIPGTVLNEQKQSNCSDLNKKCLNRESSDDKFCKSVEVPFRIKNGQTSKGREAEFVEDGKCNLILDASYVTKFFSKKSGRIIPEKELGKDSGCQEKGDNVEDGINNLIEEKCHKGRPKKGVKKRENKAKMVSPLKKTGQNTFLVEAEIHPPPSSSNLPNTEKENKDLLGLANFQVSVVLKDVFETDNLDACRKKQLLLKDNILAMKTPLIENSCNIQLSKDGSKNATSIASNSEGYSRRKREKVNYREMSGNKKLRRP